MCGGFAEGSGDEASGDEVEQEDGDERGGESEQEPVHVFVRVEGANSTSTQKHVVITGMPTAMNMVPEKLGRYQGN